MLHEHQLLTGKDKWSYPVLLKLIAERIGATGGSSVRGTAAFVNKSGQTVACFQCGLATCDKGGAACDSRGVCGKNNCLCARKDSTKARCIVHSHTPITSVPRIAALGGTLPPKLTATLERHRKKWSEANPSKGERKRAAELTKQWGVTVEEARPIGFVGTGADLNAATQNGLERAAALFGVDVPEIKNRATITGAVDIGRARHPRTRTWRAARTTSPRASPSSPHGR